MKNTILWLQLPPRKKSDGNDLYSSIKDIGEWIKRNEKLKTGKKAQWYFQLLVEVNSLDLPVQERLVFLEELYSPVHTIIENLSKKYSGSSLPLAEEHANFADVVNTFWSEMAKGYKIVIDDLSENHFFSSFLKQRSRQKDLSNALCYTLYYLSGQLYSNYRLYSDCGDNVWRDIHQIYRLAAKENLLNKAIKNQLVTKLSIDEQYKKILLFSLANPYHLSLLEMESIWSYLDQWSKYTQLNLDTTQVIKKDYPFIIKPYSDQPPFSNLNLFSSGEITDLDFPDFSTDSVWGLETKKLLKHLGKRNKYPEVSTYFLDRIQHNWMGSNVRNSPRRELIEPVVIAIGASSISLFLSEIDITPKILKLEDDQQHKLESRPSIHSFYSAYLMDESKKGIRLKLSHQTETSIAPKMGEIIAIKHSDDKIQIGYLRWMRESSQGDIEFGIEHLSAMAEPVQLAKNRTLSNQTSEQNDKVITLDSFVFPGDKEHQFKPVLFTHTFIERFYNPKTDHLVLTHKTGSINIKLVHKVNEILEYSLYLFEKADRESAPDQSQNTDADQFARVWDKI